MFLTDASEVVVASGRSKQSETKAKKNGNGAADRVFVRARQDVIVLDSPFRPHRRLSQACAAASLRSRCTPDEIRVARRDIGFRKIVQRLPEPAAECEGE